MPLNLPNTQLHTVALRNPLSILYQIHGLLILPIIYTLAVTVD